jgi:two-component system, OmpR family, sensor histidine kinase CiaH
MALVTVLNRKRKDVFFKARLKLTFFYIVFMMIIIGLFSFFLVSEIDRSLQSALKKQIVRTETFRGQFPRNQDFESGFNRINEMHTQEYASAIKAIKAMIISVDLFLLLIIIALSWVLAGRTLRPVKRAMEEQRRFMADISHDLRTPLAIIKTESEVAMSGNLSIEDYKNVIKSNIDEVDKMSSLVSDLLLLARFDDGAYVGKINGNAKTDIIELLHNILDKNKNIFLSKSHRFTLDIKNLNKHKSVFIKGDSLKIERIIQNILQNAIKYTEDKGHISISLESQRNGLSNKVKLKIKDSGIGISKKDLPHIFDRFYKASNSRSGHDGSGLGLPIAKQMIESFGGAIGIKSVEGNGTEVELFFPIV